MRIKLRLSITRFPFLLLAVSILLLARGSTSLAALDITNTATTIAADVSHYPTDPSLLPGKGPAASWSGLPQVWAERHAQWARSSDHDQGAVVFLGDSITQGWNSLAQDFPDMHVANRGIGGDTTRGVLYRLNADVLSLKPKAVVLLIGTNDIGNGARPDDVADNIEAIIRALRKSNVNLPIIICRVMPRSDQNLRFASNVRKLNTMIDQLAKTQTNAVECDTWSLFAASDGGCQPEFFRDDLLHLNQKGYAKWAAALKPIFTKLNLETKPR